MKFLFIHLPLRNQQCDILILYDPSLNHQGKCIVFGLSVWANPEPALPGGGGGEAQVTNEAEGFALKGGGWGGGGGGMTPSRKLGSGRGSTPEIFLEIA